MSTIDDTALVHLLRAYLATEQAWGTSIDTQDDGCPVLRAQLEAIQSQILRHRSRSLLGFVAQLTMVGLIAIDEVAEPYRRDVTRAVRGAQRHLLSLAAELPQAAKEGR